MMKRAAAAALALLLCIALGCEREAEAPAPSPAAGSDRPRAVDHDRDNLLAIMKGGSLVSRTAESDLEQSALHAIDGVTFTRWASPEGDGNMSAVFTLPAPTRIERLGVVPVDVAQASPGIVRFELSSDGSSWREALTLEVRPGATAHIESIPPIEAMYVRASVVEPAEESSHLRSILVEGQRAAAPQPPRFDGCWTLNGARATIFADAGRIRGTIADSTATFIDGGIDGRVARLMWLRGPMWGYAIATTTPDERHFSMVTIHEEILLGSFGRAWTGDRCSAVTSPRGSAAGIDRFLDIAGRWTMYGLAFDAQGMLIEAQSEATLDALTAHLRSTTKKHRIISREFQQDSPEANQQVAEARLTSLRQALVERGVDADAIELVAAGSRSNRIETDHAVMRYLASRIDLERIGTK